MHSTVSLHRWDELALEKVTEMISRKIITGEREMLAQIYLKKGALVPLHSHESEQITYVLQGALKFLVAGEEIIVRKVRSSTSLRGSNTRLRRSRIRSSSTCSVLFVRIGSASRTSAITTVLPSRDRFDARDVRVAEGRERFLKIDREIPDPSRSP